MTDGLSNQLDLVLKRVEALYRCDHRGRLVSINQWNGGAAPRFYLMRTADGVVCRFRGDLPDDLVGRLENLCNQEPRGEPLGKLPARYSQYLDLLSSHAPVNRVWAGPVYMSTRDIRPSAYPTAIDDNNAHLLRGGFEDWLPDVPHRRPFMAMIEDDHAVSICASVRISARAVRLLGATPFYSTSWDNIASQRVAGRLRLSLVGVDFHLT
jgi:hypothetical protein